MARRELRTDQWERLEGLLPGKQSDAGRTASDNRLFLDAVLWIARTGSHWRELPPEFGKWNSVFLRWLGLFEQARAVVKWSVCRFHAAASSGWLRYT